MSFLDDVINEIELKTSISPLKRANLAPLAFSLAHLHRPPLLGFSPFSPFSPPPLEDKKANNDLLAKCYTPLGNLLLVKVDDMAHKEYLERVNPEPRTKEINQ